MMAHSRELFARWGGGTAILSPRDSTQEQLARMSREARDLGAHALLDPQFYLPHADHERLTSHSFWPSSFQTDTFFDGQHTDMIAALAKINQEIQTRAFVVPGFMAEEVDEDWVRTQRAFITAARAATTQPLIATAALSADAVEDSDQVHRFIDFAEDADVQEYYLVLQREPYIVENPAWLINSLDLVASLRRLGAKVILGYSNQHALMAAAAGANAIAAGTYLNVRQFSGAKFEASEEEEIKRKALWYYLPQALSEFKLPFLDIAYLSGNQALLNPDPATPYLGDLLSSPQPSTSGWSETQAHRHYLDALRTQARSSTRSTFDETVANHRALLDTAEHRLDALHNVGVRGQQRDFEDAIDAHRAALTVFEATHGPALRRDWARVRAV